MHGFILQRILTRINMGGLGSSIRSTHKYAGELANSFTTYSLGLYISKKLIELHHGYVEVDSIPGQVSRHAPHNGSGLSNPDSLRALASVLQFLSKGARRSMSFSELCLPMSFRQRLTEALPHHLVHRHLQFISLLLRLVLPYQLWGHYSCS